MFLQFNKRILLSAKKLTRLREGPNLALMQLSIPVATVFPLGHFEGHLNTLQSQKWGIPNVLPGIGHMPK